MCRGTTYNVVLQFLYNAFTYNKNRVHITQDYACVFLVKQYHLLLTTQYVHVHTFPCSCKHFRLYKNTTTTGCMICDSLYMAILIPLHAGYVVCIAWYYNQACIPGSLLHLSRRHQRIHVRNYNGITHNKNVKYIYTHKNRWGYTLWTGMLPQEINVSTRHHSNTILYCI